MTSFPKKLLGVDYGTKRIGLAISDENHVFAFPKEIIENDKKTLEKINVMIQKENIGEIVIGESTNFSGKQNKLAEKIEIFISKLKKQFDLPINRQKEFLTSVEARKMGQTKANLNTTSAHSKMKKKIQKKIDASAAALILQRYLDKLNRH